MSVESEIENKLLSVTKEFLLELEADRALRAVSLDVSLAQDLGIGSLERVELFHRIEKTFMMRFSDATMLNAVSLRDLLPAIQTTSIQSKITGHATTNLQSVRADPSSTNTFVEVLTLYAQTDPNRPHIYFLNENGEEKIIRYADLLAQATIVAQGLHERGLKLQETVAIMLPTCEDFFYAFFAVLLAGGIPVPIYPPFRVDQIEEYAKREAKILSNAEVRILITFDKAETLSKLLQAFIPSLKEVTTVEVLAQSTISMPQITLAANDPALIQYTSGSTSDPKGVLLTHHNLLSNIRAVGKVVQIASTDRVVSWLPLYHDMGLIGTWLGSLYFGIPVTIMSPLFFLNRPERWLWAMHYYRGTISAGPNFAYELCVSKISDEAIQGLDLSSWRLALNGAEAIYPRTLERFSKRFSAYGFKPEAIFPVYGLAESSVALAFPSQNRLPRVDRVLREAVEKDQYAVSAAPNEKYYLEFVACGTALPGHEMRVVDDTDQVLDERYIGNLQFKGPSSMQGYFRNPEATRAAYHDGWWDTGDLAYFANGEVFITGRRKDVIIKAGRNLYAQELEEITNQVNKVRRGCVVAFGINDTKTGTEKLIIVAETNDKNEETRQQISAEIIANITTAIGMPPDHVILVPPRTIPKTSSGKLRRAACKENYLHGKLLHNKGTPFWLQLTKLFLTGVFKKIKKGVGTLAKFLYNAYLLLISLPLILLFWLLLPVMPTKFCGKFCKILARILFGIAGCRITLQSLQKDWDKNPVIFVVNHSSYIDALLLLAVLPANVAFVGKSELLTSPIIKSFFKKLNYLTVDRWDFSQSLTDMQQIEEVLQQGRSIAIFPEGTFTYAQGLRPFKLGAFKAAVETGRPICPVAICGTRNILRDESRLLKPGPIKVTVGQFITAKDNDWSEIIRLRTVARSEIAKYCGEPVIDFIAAGPVV